jgi:hypothetical protein
LEENEMKDFGPRNSLEQLVAKFERGLFLVFGLALMVLLTVILFLVASGKANAAGYNSWPAPKGIAQCWTSLFEEYGTNMLKVTQTVSADSALVKYRITLQSGEEKELICHSASGNLTEAEQER